MYTRVGLLCGMCVYSWLDLCVGCICTPAWVHVWDACALLNELVCVCVCAHSCLAHVWGVCAFLSGLVYGGGVCFCLARVWGVCALLSGLVCGWGCVCTPV